MIKEISAGVAMVAMYVALAVGLSVGGYYLYAFLAPKYEATRRDVMIQSRAYSEGSTREMYRLKLQYQQAKSDDERATIRAFVAHEAQAFDRDRLPADLQSFLAAMGG